MFRALASQAQSVSQNQFRQAQFGYTMVRIACMPDLKSGARLVKK